MKIKKLSGIIILLSSLVFMYSCGGRYKYEKFSGDPMHTRIYTLDNGLKVYMSVNKATPRIQTYIAVKVGAKNDPIETTGLAHYFEHLMFKGTPHFGTINYDKEKPLLDSIENNFEYYRTITDPSLRKKVYARIDSISYQASKYAVANEYDKLMAAIGAEGSNASTGYDCTIFQENIPSNEITNWAKIQSDRFMNPVIRGFHTELEAVYEEKNISLTNDSRKVINKVFQTLFPHHPYGLQTVLGTQQQLKNPSITNIKKYFKNWYVSNNIAICLSGDFDPDTMINVIHKYFGAMKPNQDIKRLKIVPETPITKPVKKIVYGPMAENITIAWRFPAMNNPAADTLELISKVLTNGRAGLMDLNVNQAQKVLESYTYYYPMADYSMLIMQGMPKSGQTLDQVKSIMLNEINKLKSGDFSDTLLTSIINNEKRYDMSQLQDNGYRANMYVDAFVNDIPWKKEYKKSERMEKLSREDIIKFAKKYLDSNYVEVKKLQGEDTSVHKIDKPHITPILTNRDTASLFLKNIKNSKVNPIEPVFADFEKDLKIIVLKNGDTLLYKKNTHNSLFDMSFIYDFGRSSDKTLPFASTYSDYLGTSAYTAKQLSSMFYEMAVDRYINIGNYQTSINLYGLQEYQDKALDLLEESINDMQPDEKALESVKSDIFKSRSNAKTSQRSCFYALLDYIIYGPKNPQTYTLSNKEISGLKSGELISELKKLGQYKCKVVYYGPEDVESVAKRLNEDEFLSATKTPCPVSDHFSMPETKKSILYLAPYKANNIYYVALTNEGRRFDPKAEPSVEMFNGYFGGGMGSIVFQDIREARGLAYSAGAYYDSPSYTDMPYCFYTYIITQNDKLMDASRAMTGIVEDMPIASKTFEIAKKNIMDRLRTDRIKDEDLPGYYLRMKRLGLNYDSRRDLFEKLPALTLDDISGFQKKYIKGKTFSYAILGNEKDLKIGEFAKENKCIVERLSLEDIFGY